MAFCRNGRLRLPVMSAVEVAPDGAGAESAGLKANPPFCRLHGNAVFSFEFHNGRRLTLTADDR
jgi:hypothetical protein